MAAGGFSLALDDGRELDGWRGGAGGASAVLLHVGTPSAGIAYEPMVAEAASRGLGFVTYSRPGYGASTRQPGRSVAACAADVATLVERLELGRLYVVGWSGGGPHALACAALLPELVASVATLGGVAPYAADGLDWLDGMAEENPTSSAPRTKVPPPSGTSWSGPPTTSGGGRAPPSRTHSAGSSPRSTARPGRPARRLPRPAQPGGRRARDLGLVRRRSRVRPRLGVPAGRHHRAGDRVAGDVRTQLVSYAHGAGSPVTSPARAMVLEDEGISP